MYIHEAVTKAMEINGLIYRKKTLQICDGIQAAIRPTNTYDACILVVLEDRKIKRSCRLWEPTADDLSANDWQVLGNKFCDEVCDRDKSILW